jgi:hypothetical protein
MSDASSRPTAQDQAGCGEVPPEIISPGTDLISPRSTAQWIAVLLVLGAVARLVRFGLRFPLWPDEAFVAANFLDRGYWDLLRPLEYHQVCPLLFLWAELTATKLLGFSEYSLRLVPLISSLAGLLLFRHAAGRLFRGPALVLAIGIFAVAYPGIRFANDVKPYGSDAFVTVALVAMLLEWRRCPQKTRWLWALALAAPIGVWFSYPAIFVAGGISLAVAWLLWTETAHGGLSRFSRRRRLLPGKSDRRRENGTVPFGAAGWLAWSAYNLSLAAGFVALYLASIRSQNAELARMQQGWQAAFPPLDSAWRLAVWLAKIHTGDMVSYPVEGLGLLGAAASATALVIFCRRRQFWLPILCGVTLALNFAAAALQRYAYGEPLRAALYSMPLVCLLTGLGFAAMLDRCAPAARRRVARRALLVVLVLLALVPLGSMVRDFGHPGKTDDDIRFRDLSRWFWPEMAHGAELVCLDLDRATRFAPTAFEFDNSSQYLCMQRIYTPPRACREPPRLDRLSARHPLRCARYRAWGYADDPALLSAWLDPMRRRYDLTACREYPISYRLGPGAELQTIGWLVVYEFVPRMPRGKAKPGATGSASAVPETKQ